MAPIWSPEDYARDAAFVPELGASILERLAPTAGQRILDLGCGDGTLTARVASSGAGVVGVDSSREMVAAARARGLDARVMDATRLAFKDEFDAVFSNAVLHWVLDADSVLAGVHRALRDRGRLVAEFGGHGNVAAIAVAIRAVFERHGVLFSWPWYYPTPAEYRSRLEAHGFIVHDIILFPRPTPLPSGMAGWLRTFAGPFFGGVPPGQKARMEQDIMDLLRPSLCDAGGQWTADYVRLQVVASKLRPG